MKKKTKIFILWLAIILILSVMAIEGTDTFFENPARYPYLSIGVITIGTLLSHIIVAYIADVKGKSFVQLSWNRLL